MYIHVYTCIICIYMYIHIIHVYTCLYIHVLYMDLICLSDQSKFPVTANSSIHLFLKEERNPALIGTHVREQSFWTNSFRLLLRWLDKYQLCRCWLDSFEWPVCIHGFSCHSEWSLLNCPNCLIRLGRMRCDSCRVIHVYEFPAAMMACRWVQRVMRPLAGELASVVHVMGNWGEAFQTMPAPRHRYTLILVYFPLSISHFLPDTLL